MFPYSAITDWLGSEALTPWMEARDFVLRALDALTPYSTIISLILIVGIVYNFMRVEKIVHETKHEDEPHGHGHEGYAAHGAKGKTKEQESSVAQKRWQRIQAHLDSERESDWRLAVLEADVLLDEMVTNMGYHGDSLGERLKAIEKSDFLTLDAAWEAHAVRNKIAHEGAAFTLTEREAQRVVKLYEDVFKEFKFI